MKAGTENRNKTVIAGGLAAAAVLSCGWVIYSQFGGSSTPPPAPAPTAAAGPVSNAVATNRATYTAASNTATGTGRSASGNGPAPAAIPGVAAERVATTSASLDPTLDQAAMLRTESLLYSGAGRNIFSATYTPPAPVIPKQTIGPRPGPVTPPPPYVPPPPVTCPPSCPPINLKFFGTATRANGQRQAFLLQGEDVYLASTGDIVARKYKIGTITLQSVQVTDLQNNYTQNLPFQQQ